MSLILRWLLGKMNGLFADCFSLAVEMAKSAFSNPAVSGLLSAFKSFGLPLLGIAILVSLIKKIIEIMDGGSIGFGDLMKRYLIGILAYQYGVRIFKWLFLWVLEMGKVVIEAITGTQEFDVNIIMDFGIQSNLFVLILVIISVFYMLKTIMSLLERFWLLLMTLAMLYFYIPGYINGSDESLIIWGKQCIGFSLTQFFQTIVLVLGMSLYIATGSLSDFALAIGGIIGASKADTILDKFGQSSGGKMGNAARNAMSASYYASSLLKK